MELTKKYSSYKEAIQSENFSAKCLIHYIQRTALNSNHRKLEEKWTGDPKGHSTKHGNPNDQEKENNSRVTSKRHIKIKGDL